MLKTLLSLLFVGMAFFANAQKSDWNSYYASEQLTISVRYSDCHSPQNGMHDQYVLMKWENMTDEKLEISYELEKWHIIVGSKQKEPQKAGADKKGYTLSIPANSSLESNCDNLQKGLYIYSKILSVKPKSILSKFEVINLNINGKKVNQ